MTLSTICQNVARELGLNVPTAVYGSTDKTAEQLWMFARRTGLWLKRNHDWQTLNREHEITTANGTASYALPSDYDRYVDDTAWDRTNYWKMRGSLSPKDWQVRKSAIIATTAVRKRFRVKWDSDNSAKRVFIDPTPTATETLVIEYQSDAWVYDTSAAAYANDWTADGDTTVFDEELMELGTKWRMKAKLGLSYLEEQAEFERHAALAAAQEQPADEINLSGRMDWPINIVESGFGS